jgi:NADH:ubiquinone oxidoreductase subunit 5 (subunit L)/multisubunit Na+/H+ antiporter MnhA subunit
MPAYALFFMLFTMASVGLPGTSGFVGEFLSLAGIYEASSFVAFVCTTGIILGAAYMLYLYRRVVFGELTKDDVRAMPDLSTPANGLAGADRCRGAVDGCLSRKLPRADAQGYRHAARPPGADPTGRRHADPAGQARAGRRTRLYP